VQSCASTGLRVPPGSHPARDHAHVTYRAVFVPLTQRAIVELSGTTRLFARPVDEKVRLQVVPEVAFTPLGQSHSPVQHLKLR